MNKIFTFVFRNTTLRFASGFRKPSSDVLNWFIKNFIFYIFNYHNKKQYEPTWKKKGLNKRNIGFHAWKTKSGGGITKQFLAHVHWFWVGLFWCDYCSCLYIIVYFVSQMLEFTIMYFAKTQLCCFSFQKWHQIPILCRFEFKKPIIRSLSSCRF